MDLTMKAIKHSEWASEETFCYQGNVYLDGKLFARVSNNGHGGSDRVELTDLGYGSKLGKETFSETMDVLKEYFESLPKDKSEWFPEGLSKTFESWCHEQVMNFLIRKDVRRIMSKKYLFKCDDGLFDVSHNVNPARILRDHPEAVILNNLPEAEAIAIYTKETS